MSANMTLTLTMDITPNPDFERGSRAGFKPVRLTAKVASIKEAVAVMQQVIADRGLGGGNIGGCPVTTAFGTELCRISYNGRCWTRAGVEVVPA